MPLRHSGSTPIPLHLIHYPAIAALECDIQNGLSELVGSLGVCCRSFILFLPILGMFGGPPGGSLFDSEPLDYFRLAIRPHNIDHPVKSGIASRRRRTDVRTSHEYAPTAARFKPVILPYQTDPLPCHVSATCRAERRSCHQARDAGVSALRTQVSHGAESEKCHDRHQPMA
jgi:hypothetical protein